MKIQYETELYHHGIKGQKWGVRRFQDAATGTLTDAGRERYRAKVQGKIADLQKKRGVDKATATRTVDRRERVKNFAKTTAKVAALAAVVALGPTAWSMAYMNCMAMSAGAATAGLYGTTIAAYGGIGVAYAKNALSNMTLEEIKDENIRSKASNVNVNR